MIVWFENFKLFLYIGQICDLCMAIKFKLMTDVNLIILNDNKKMLNRGYVCLVF